MIECEVLHADGVYYIEYAYTLDEFRTVELDPVASIKKSKYINTFITFDIENSVIKNEKETLLQNRDVYNGFMYIAHFCIQGEVVFVRTWEEFENLLDLLIQMFSLSTRRKLVIYVHNLSYEYFFIKDFVKFNSTFSYDKRKIIKAESDYFEFRCSYILSNMNLNKLLLNYECIHIKAKDDLDYSVIRTPTTILTKKQYGYCFNDVAGLYEAIETILKRTGDDVQTIPLTSTGFVRRDCRNAMRLNKKNRKRFLKTRLNDETYKLLQEAFRGGNTASNRYKTGFIINNVKSMDITSSYPTEMMSDYYPVGKFIKWNVETIDDLLQANNNYCTVARYYFNNIKIKDNIPIAYIPFYKCNEITKTSECYNGRVLQADYISITLTEIDFRIIQEQYSYDEVYVEDMLVSRRGSLPYEIKNQIKKYFYDKSLLKYEADKQYEYRTAKAKLNSIYGMFVTSPVKELYILKDGEIVISEEKETLDDYYRKFSSFLSYQQGVWVTAHARENLQRAIDLVGMDVIYCDTDSVKYAGNHDDCFKQLNKVAYDEATADMKVVANNKEYVLGLWDEDGEYDSFITLGAKKYAYTHNQELSVTVSGLAKIKGAEELKNKGGLKEFKIGEVFTNSGRTIAQYHDHEDVHLITVNGDTFTTASNIAIIPTTYTLGVTNTMLQQLKEWNGDDIFD